MEALREQKHVPINDYNFHVNIFDKLLQLFCMQVLGMCLNISQN